MTGKYSARENRRRAVRVNDRLLFSCRQIEAERLRRIRDDLALGISLYNQEQFAGLSYYLGAHHALTRIKERDEDLGEFLQQMDSKINRILAAICRQPTPFDPLEQADVNISGSGVAFASGKRYAVGDEVELLMVLLPQQLHLYAIGKVISSEAILDDEAGQWRTAIDFFLIMDEDREKLIQHIFQRQQMALRERRLIADAKEDARNDENN